MLPDLERISLWWGPGILVLIAFGYGVLRLAHYWIEKTTEVRRQQVENVFSLLRHYIEQFLRSQGSQADALSRLATCIEHRESTESFEHQEILIALKAIHRDLGSLSCRRGDVPCSLQFPPGSARRSGGRNLPSVVQGAEEGAATPADSPPARPSQSPSYPKGVSHDEPESSS